jgi:endogenous inhibitor of DNA gyrase (YacG/DUF329 family)
MRWRSFLAKLFATEGNEPRRYQQRYCPRCGRPRVTSEVYDGGPLSGPMMMPPTPHEMRTGCSSVSCKYHSLPSVTERPTEVESPESARPVSIAERLADINDWLDEQQAQPPETTDDT